jgi:CRP-like cAMP-binding protein
MSSQEGKRSLVENRILAALSTEQYLKLFSKFQMVSLPPRHIIFEQGRPIRFIYFPITSMISLISVGGEGSRGVEVCTIGREGIAGLSIFLDSDIALGQAIVQLPGTAARVETNIFREVVNQRGPLNSIIKRYMQVQIISLLRAALCVNFHKVEARLARLLLLMHDSAQENTFPLTQEFAAYLLGLHRPAVSMAARALQGAGLIRYRQGKITVLDRDRLLTVTCECYRIVTKEYARLLDPVLTRENDVS